MFRMLDGYFLSWESLTEMLSHWGPGQPVWHNAGKSNARGCNHGSAVSVDPNYTFCHVCTSSLIPHIVLDMDGSRYNLWTVPSPKFGKSCHRQTHLSVITAISALWPTMIRIPVEWTVSADVRFSTDNTAQTHVWLAPLTSQLANQIRLRAWSVFKLRYPGSWWMHRIPQALNPALQQQRGGE